MKRLLILAAVCLVLASRATASPAEGAAKGAAQQFFDAYKVPSAQTASEWRITEVRIFGQMPSTVVLVDSSPITYRVDIPFWCSGVLEGGQAAKLKRTLSVEVALDGAAWRVRRHYFVGEEQLSFMEQAGRWLLSSFLTPILLFLCLRFTVFLFARNATSWAAGVAGLSSFPLAGWFGYFYFGSVLAVFVALAIFVACRAVLSGLATSEA